MSNKKELKGIVGWINYRLPIFSFLKHQGEYQTPKNLSYMWSLGSIAGIVLVLQILTGLFLAMNYTANVSLAFDSVERIMRDVNFGWLLRYTHAVGASMFFVVIYLHMIRGLYYGSYKGPREMLWWFGIIIFLVMMGTAFMGYVLPWGQMSFWGATVITNLFGALDAIAPGVGTWVKDLLLGNTYVSNPTITKFFTLHFLLPFVLVGLVVIHLIALHIHGSNNPTGVDVKTKKDTINFHPFYTIKDFFGFGVFFLIFFAFVFFAPNYMGHPDNYIEANPLKTPASIVPEWYFLPFYAILRAVPNITIPFTDIIILGSKPAGVLAMFGSILILFVLPWLDRHPVKSGKYRPIFKCFFWIFIFNGVLLAWLGGQHAEQPYTGISQICAVYYFSYFLIILPLLSKYEKALPLPDSIDSAVKEAHQAKT